MEEQNEMAMFTFDSRRIFHCNAEFSAEQMKTSEHMTNKESHSFHAFVLYSIFRSLFCEWFFCCSPIVQGACIQCKYGIDIERECLNEKERARERKNDLIATRVLLGW